MQDDMSSEMTDRREELVSRPEVATKNPEESGSNPEPIHTDSLFCQICRKAIPEKRKTRRTSVCSERCKNRLDTIRKKQSADRKCNLCMHPSTPEERAEFRKWRAERGDVKSERIIARDLSWPPKDDLKNALRSAIRSLENEAYRYDSIAKADTLKTFSEVEECRPEAAKRAEILRVKVRDYKQWLDKSAG